MGDDFTLMAPLLTLTPASQTTLLGLTGDARDAAESFGDFMERLDEAGSEPDGGEHHQTVVVDATLSVGNDTLTSGGGTSVLVGDDMTIIAPTITVPADRVLGLERAVDDLGDAQEDVAEGVAELSDATHELRVVGQQAHIDRIITGNDRLLGGAGHDLLVGDDWTQVAPTIVVTRATGPVLRSDEDEHDHDLEHDRFAPDDQVVSGNDTLVGGGNTDVLVGGSVEVGAAFVRAGGGVAPLDFGVALGQARELTAGMASLADDDGDEHTTDTFEPSNRKFGSMIIRGEGEELFKNGGARKLLINWSESFNAFGSAQVQGVRFPTKWVQPFFWVDF